MSRNDPAVASNKKNSRKISFPNSLERASHMVRRKIRATRVVILFGFWDVVMGKRYAVGTSNFYYCLVGNIIKYSS